MVSEKKIFLSYSYYKTMGDNKPRGTASLEPRGLIGRIYVGYLLTFILKLLVLSLMVSEKKSFESFLVI